MKYSINKPLTMLNDLRIAGLLQALLFPLLTALLVNFSMINTARAEQGCTPLQIANNVENCVASKTHSKVLQRGVLRCGVGFLPGFSFPTPRGELEGFDVDMCRVIAAAVLGDSNAVEIISLSPDERFAALRKGDIDVLMRNSTVTLIRDAVRRNSGEGVDFGPPYFYDGQSFMVNKAGPGLSDISRNSTIADLPDGTTVCLLSGTTLEVNFLAASAAANKTFAIVPIEHRFQGLDLFIDGICDVMTSDRTQLGELSAIAIDVIRPPPRTIIILTTTISHEPLAPVVKEKDREWLAIVSWSVQALFFAEEEGITSSNIVSLRNSTRAISAVFGKEADRIAGLLGLERRWAFRVIKQVGNYGEIYDRHLPQLNIIREGSENALFSGGGLIYSLPMR